jgi:hypothetical protein
MVSAHRGLLWRENPLYGITYHNVLKAQFQNHWRKRICVLTYCGSAIMRFKFRSLISCMKIKRLWKARRHDNQALLSTYLFCASLFELILFHEFWLKETWHRSVIQVNVYLLMLSKCVAGFTLLPRSHPMPIKRTVILGRYNVNMSPSFVHVRRRNWWKCSDFEKHMHNVVPPRIARCVTCSFI